MSKPNRWGAACLILLPIVLSLVFHHPEWLAGRRSNLGPDGHFYVYQMGRIAELNGAWWKLGDDPLVGDPYPTGAAKNPGLFEGLDLLLIGAVVGPFLGPVGTYHFAGMAALAMNGWASSWLALRLSRSYWAAALASLFTTVNLPTLLRLEGLEHLHLVKYSWIILSFWAFSRYLDRPTSRSGVWLGLAVAGTLLASFHFGFFLGIGLAAWWLGCLLSGTIRRAHVRPTIIALIAAGLLAGLGTFPVWAGTKNPTLAKLYSQREFANVWTFSAEPWQYVTRPATKSAEDRLKGSGRIVVPNSALLTDSQLDRHMHGLFERYGNAAGGWNFYGFSVLAGLGVYGVGRLRGSAFGVEHPVVLDRMAGMIALFILLSLAGGPGALLYDLTPQFRCYGRAGLVALPLAAVLAAVALHGLIASRNSFAARVALVTLLIGMLAFDWRDGARMRLPREDPQPPAWVPWLKDQPDDVRLVALPATEGSFCGGEVWHWQSLSYSLEHRHQTLNGAEYILFLSDLQLLGCGYEDLSPAGLRFLATLGYNTVAFDAPALKRIPWLPSIPWLKRDVELADGWTVWRIDATAPKFPVVTRGELVARGIGPSRTVPAGAVLCPRFELNETLVVADPRPVEAIWIDGQGKASGRATRILEQFVYGPGLGAYTVRAPAKPGDWKLRFRDAKSGAALGEQPFRVVDPFPVAPDDAQTAQAIVTPLTQFADGSFRIRVANASPYYVSARASGEPIPVSHPTLSGFTAGTLVLILRIRELVGDREESFELRRAYLSDLAPGEEYEVVLPAGTFAAEAKAGREIVGVLYSGPTLVPLVDVPTLRMRIPPR